MDDPRTDTHVTLICELGCVRVREVIAILRQGGLPTETAGLDAAARRRILQELESIMAIYDARS